MAKASVDIKRGEEILLQYGRKGFVKYFLIYGFMPDEANEDAIGFIAQIKDSPEEKWKIGFSAGQHRFFRSISATLEQNTEFFELIRWVVFNEEDDCPPGTTPLQKFDPKNPGIPPTSVNNEKKAWKYLK